MSMFSENIKWIELNYWVERVEWIASEDYETFECLKCEKMSHGWKIMMSSVFFQLTASNFIHKNQVAEQ